VHQVERGAVLRRHRGRRVKYAVVDRGTVRLRGIHRGEHAAAARRGIRGVRGQWLTVDPDRARALAEQVHLAAGEQPVATRTRAHRFQHQVVPVAQHGADHLDEGRSDGDAQLWRLAAHPGLGEVGERGQSLLALLHVIGEAEALDQLRGDVGLNGDVHQRELGLVLFRQGDRAAKRAGWNELAVGEVEDVLQRLHE
jgi:hypothetical protein